MSARSAAARKKITTTQKKGPPSAAANRPRPRAYAPVEYEYSYPYGQQAHFAPPPHQYYSHQPPPPPPPPESVIGTSSSGSQSAPSEAEDVSGIERSGFRTMLDKRSDGVRRGLAKTFTFRKKDKEDEAAAQAIPERPESTLTARQNSVGDGYGYDRPISSINTQNVPYYPQQSYPGHYAHYQHQSPVSPIDRWEMNSLGPPPAVELPAVPQNNGPSIKRWNGGGRPPSRWNKLRKDPELWNPNGDVLVFLHDQGHDQPANFRLSSHVIEASENRWLVTELRNGFTEDRDDIPTPPTNAYNSHLGQPTPPVSESDQLEGEISYEMRFPTPKGLNRADKVRHQITTRNIFAMLCRVSLVGISLHQALVDLHARLDQYRAPGEPSSAGQIHAYLSHRTIDDVRNDPESAVGILAWAERPGVKWSEGWREAFLHCAGMYGGTDGRGGGLERCADWKYVAPQTRALLERSWLETRLKLQTAEERLAEFTFNDIWAGGATSEFRSTPPVGSAKATAERFQKMLLGHYTRVYGSWPPRPSASGSTDDDEEIWLTRTVTRDLQKDFGALYDFLVDREVIWDVSEARAGRKWMMVSAGWNKGFDADVPSMPLTDILIEFDNRLRLPHIPHPHPLLPSSILPQPPVPASGGMFKSSTSSTSLQQKQANRDRRVALAYTESTNIEALDASSPSPSGLIDAFSRFEKNDLVADVDPAMARRGRWVLLYGILQALAPVSVDAPGVKYSDSVAYHLSARLKKPSWVKERGQTSGLFGEVRHDMSHCWTVPATWNSETDGQTTDDTEEEDERATPHEEFAREDFRRPRPSLPELSEGGSSVRTSSARRFDHQSQRRADDSDGNPASPVSPASQTSGSLPRSRFYTQLPPVPGLDGADSFLNISDVTFPTARAQQQPPILQIRTQPPRERRGGEKGGGFGTPQIRDFDEHV